MLQEKQQLLETIAILQAQLLSSPKNHHLSESAESEGTPNKNVLMNIGSMAQLKHPRKFWPRSTNRDV